ncbi:probable calcium-binding protein CML11 [Miscanthus floridulus]|uniref:probable calcium-binding protein CML11 n=1 Tax=Miscanthus floridulus TaxID=154761 RepID=UPI0034593C28
MSDATTAPTADASAVHKQAPSAAVSLETTMASIRRGGGSSVAATISQASQQQQQPRLDDDQLAELREIFWSFDRKANGSLTPSADQLDALITRADTNSNGLVEFSEFVALVAPDLLADRSPYSEDQLRKLFAIFDGFID